jgi:hypothetical protein
MSNTTQMPTKSTLRQDCLTPGKFFQSAALAILCHDSKDAFHSECSLLASLIRFLVIILTDISLQLVNLLSRRIFTVCKVLYSARGVVKDMGFVDTHRDLRNPTNGRKRERMNEQVQTISGPDRHFMERAMGIEQIQMNQTKALPPVPQFNWSQMESSDARSYDSLIAGVKIGKLGWRGSIRRSERKIPPQDPGSKKQNPGHPAKKSDRKILRATRHPCALFLM